MKDFCIAVLVGLEIQKVPEVKASGTLKRLIGYWINILLLHS
jgi:hypothetical protein